MHQITYTNFSTHQKLCSSGSELTTGHAEGEFIIR